MAFKTKEEKLKQFKQVYKKTDAEIMEQIASEKHEEKSEDDITDKEYLKSKKERADKNLQESGKDKKERRREKKEEELNKKINSYTNNIISSTGEIEWRFKNNIVSSTIDGFINNIKVFEIKPGTITYSLYIIDLELSKKIKKTGYIGCATDIHKLKNLALKNYESIK